MSGYPQNQLITLWRIGSELLVVPADASHPLPVCRVRMDTGRASLSLRPGTVVILRRALASLRNALQAAFVEHAEAGVLEMGRTWWPSLQREDDQHRWEYAAGVVWFNSIILLDDVENSILRGLKFPDAWTVTGSTDAPVLRDEWGNDWRDITR